MTPKSSEAAVAESESGSKINGNEDVVVDVEAAVLPDELHAPAPLPKIRKIQICMIVAAASFTLLWVYTTLLYVALPYAVSDPSARKEVSWVLLLMSLLMLSMMKSLVLPVIIFCRRNE